MDSPPNRRNALGNADRLVSPGSTAICVTRRIYRLYIRCRSKRSQASFHCGLCNNCSMLLSHSCSGKGPQTHRTVKSLFLVYSSEPPYIHVLHIQSGGPHTPTRNSAWSSCHVGLLHWRPRTTSPFHLGYETTFKCTPCIPSGIHYRRCIECHFHHFGGKCALSGK